MQRFSLFTLALTSSALSSPLATRNICPNVPSAPFQLVAVNNVAPQDPNFKTYPLAANFPAEFNENLQVYASTGTPYSNTTAFDYAGPPLEALQTSHVPNYPPGPAETFDSVSPALSGPFQLSYTAPTSGHLTYICEPGYPSYFTIDDGGDFGFSLCVNSQVDTVLHRKALYWRGTDPSCESVSLRVA